MSSKDALIRRPTFIPAQFEDLIGQREEGGTSANPFPIIAARLALMVDEEHHGSGRSSQVEQWIHRPDNLSIVILVGDGPEPTEGIDDHEPDVMFSDVSTDLVECPRDIQESALHVDRVRWRHS
jgi:hypothetical protein